MIYSEIKTVKNWSLPIVFIMLFITVELKAQEYQHEIGGAVGMGFYMGDANKSKLFQNTHPAGGIIYRYNRDFRWAYKGNLLFGTLSGDTKKSGNVFPNNQEASFSRTFVEIGGQIEFNFFNYSDQYAYLGTKRLSPYIFTGLGLTYGSGEETFFGLNLPLGIGLKYKVKQRLNLGFEFSFRKLFADKFDVTQKNEFTLDNPYGIKSSIFKNQDWYVLSMFSITWDFGIRSKSCVNNLY